MGKPTQEELEQALREAARMREQGEDPYFVAKALLNLNFRHGHLLKVLEAARHFLRSGLATQEHMRLQRAIDQALEAEARTSGDESEEFGLE